MGKGRILIIASYNGTDRHRIQYAPFQFLNAHHHQLTTLKHSLDKVLIVVNKAHSHDWSMAEYEESLKNFPHILRRANDQGSYGAWRDGYLANPGYEWYFFLEDDYTLFLDDFDQKLIDLWQPETTYISTMANTMWGHRLHASIANGLTRGDILEQVDWGIMSAPNIYDSNLQLQWSDLFAPGLTDFRHKYAAPYNMRYGVPIQEYGNPNLPVIIGPVDLFLDKTVQETYVETTYQARSIREIDPMRHKQRMMDDPEYRVIVESE